MKLCRTEVHGVGLCLSLDPGGSWAAGSVPSRLSRERESHRASPTFSASAATSTAYICFTRLLPWTQDRAGVLGTLPQETHVWLVGGLGGGNECLAVQLLGTEATSASDHSPLVGPLWTPVKKVQWRELSTEQPPPLSRLRVLWQPTCPHGVTCLRLIPSLLEAVGAGMQAEIFL